MYFVSEPGYLPDSEFSSLADAETEANNLSIQKSVPIAISDQDDEVISIALDGEIFDKRKPD